MSDSTIHSHSTDLSFKEHGDYSTTVGSVSPANQPVTSSSRLQKHPTDNNRDEFLQLIHDISCDLDVAIISHKILTHVTNLTRADRCSLFIVTGNGKSRALMAELFDVVKGSTVDETHRKKDVLVPWGKGIVGHVAVTGESINIPNAYEYEHFNKEVDHFTGYRTTSVMCQPIKTKKGEVIGVAQAINKNDGNAFTSSDETVFQTYLTFCGLLLTKAQLCESLTFAVRKNEALVRMANDLLKPPTNLHNVVHKSLVEGHQLIQCQFCSVMVVGKEVDETEEIQFNDVFGLSQENWTKGKTSSSESQSGEVMAAYLEHSKQVVNRGMVLNMSDFETQRQHSVVVPHGKMPLRKSFLCLPIYNDEKKIIGVIQFLNKVNNLYFDKKDEDLAEAIAMFCGRGINNTTLHENMRKAVARKNIATEALLYHMLSSVEEAEYFGSLDVPASHEFSDNLMSLSFDEARLSDDDTVLATVRLFLDSKVMEPFHINQLTLIRWILTVKKNYRQVPYHNWRHAFTVAQSMFTLIMTGNLMKKLSAMERLMLIVACLCHDLDHRGRTNQFITQSSSPIADLYSTATMEHHHIDVSIMILDSQGHNIFENMDNENYKLAIKLLKKRILATELNSFFQRKNSFLALVENDEFDWSDKSHHDIGQEMLMTASDVCAVTKPWPVQQRIAGLLADEFLEQHAIEMSQPDKFPLPIVTVGLPATQVKFIDAVSLPVYKALAKLLPRLNPLYQQLKSNRQIWQTLADETLSTKSTETRSQECKDDTNFRQRKHSKHQSKKHISKDQINELNVDDKKDHPSKLCSVM